MHIARQFREFSRQTTNILHCAVMMDRFVFGISNVDEKLSECWATRVACNVRYSLTATIALPVYRTTEQFVFGISTWDAKRADSD